MLRHSTIALALVLLPLLGGGCETDQSVLFQSGEDQARLRAMQSRRFDTTDEQMVLRAIIGTMMDLGFVLDDANAPLGIVSATKLQSYTTIRLTATVQDRPGSIIVRVSAQQGLSPIEDPEAYREFFRSLSKSMFLEAHDVE